MSVERAVGQLKQESLGSILTPSDEETEAARKVDIGMIDKRPGAIARCADVADAAFFQALLADFRRPGAAFSLKHQSVEGNQGFILWTAETADNVYGLGTDTFVVQTFAGKIKPKQSLKGGSFYGEISD